MAGVKFTREAAKRIAEATRKVEREQPNGIYHRQKGRGVEASFVRGYLDGALSAASSAGATAATATLSVWAVRDGTWQDTGRNVTVTNRDTTLSLAAGKYVTAKVIGGEWTIDWVSC